MARMIRLRQPLGSRSAVSIIGLAHRAAGGFSSLTKAEGGKVTSYGVKLDDTVPGILKFGICARLSPDEAMLPQFLDKIAFTDDVSAIKNVLAKHSGVAKLSYALAGESFRIPTLRMNRA
jgi:hypothetical protein